MKRLKNKTIIIILFLIITSIAFQIFSSSKYVVISKANTDSEKIICNASIEDDFSNNEILVVLNNENSGLDQNYDKSDFKDVDCLNVKDLTKTYDTEDEINDGFRRILKLTIDSDNKSKVLDAIKVLEIRDDIVSAEPNYYDIPQSIPNDAEFSKQSKVDNLINLSDAWDITTGSGEVNVGIIDSGIDGSHKDLKNNINTELSCCFSDDFTNALEDATGHGTHVAGIIGAEGNNGLGIAGTNWNVGLVSLRVAKTDGRFPIDNVIEAIGYANEKNIPILNYSGGGYTYNDSVIAREQAIKNYNGLFVCSAGNDNIDIDETAEYPASHNLDNLISVGAIDSDGNKRATSNYGKISVDMFAPGGDIYSTLPNNTYGAKSGTSMAAPHVAGVAALIYAKCPDITASEVKKFILNNVDKVDSLKDLCVTGGKLNAYKAVNAAHTVNHTAAYKYYDENTHEVFCQYCNYSMGWEAHTFILYGTQNSVNAVKAKRICTGCGYIVLGNGIGMIPNKKEDEKI